MTVSDTAGRPDWDDYFLDLVTEVGRRATCDRGRSGCVIVKDKRILCTGYVGSPAGFPHCDEAGHMLRRVVAEDDTVREHCARTIHAEQNAIRQAARYGILLEGSTLYCTMEPCRTCALLIISVGVTRVVARARYHAGADTRAMSPRPASNSPSPPTKPSPTDPSPERLSFQTAQSGLRRQTLR